MRAQATKQISVFLENRAGIVADLCDALTERSINIIALTILDTLDIGTLRMVVDDVELAKKALQEVGAAYVEVPVVTLRVPNSPGAFSAFARQLTTAGVNIEYCYATCVQDVAASLAVFRVLDINAALDIDFEIPE